jgi:hypothetical protein
MMFVLLSQIVSIHQGENDRGKSDIVAGERSRFKQTMNI